MNEPLVSQDEIFSIMLSSPKKPNFQYQTYLGVLMVETVPVLELGD